MGDPKAFLTIHRKEAGYRPVHDRIHDFGEVEQTLNSNDRRQQAARGARRRARDVSRVSNWYVIIVTSLVMRRRVPGCP